MPFPPPLYPNDYIIVLTYLSSRPKSRSFASLLIQGIIRSCRNRTVTVESANTSDGSRSHARKVRERYKYASMRPWPDSWCHFSRIISSHIRNRHSSTDSVFFLNSLQLSADYQYRSIKHRLPLLLQTPPTEWFPRLYGQLRGGGGVPLGTPLDIMQSIRRKKWRWAGHLART